MAEPDDGNSITVLAVPIKVAPTADSSNNVSVADLYFSPFSFNSKLLCLIHLLANNGKRSQLVQDVPGSHFSSRGIGFL